MRHFDELTVVVPTYNRPKYLKRSLDYWGATAFKIIVADGSDKKYDGDIPLNVAYFHSNELLINERWSNALQKVKTPYVVFCADDDFLSLSGIKNCLDYLNNFSDYSSAQGLAVTFEIDNKRDVFVEMANAKMVGHQIDGDFSSERLDQLFDEYIYQIYSIYRTPLLQKAVDACTDLDNPHYIELASAIVPSIFGKHKVLPVFYSARQHIPGSSSGSFEVPRFDILKARGMINYKAWKTNIVNIYAQAESVPLENALRIIEKTLTKYYEWDSKTFPDRIAMDASFWSFPTRYKIKVILKIQVIKMY